MKKLTLLAFAMWLLGCNSPKMGVSAEDFKTQVDGKDVALYTLKNEQGTMMQVTNYGGCVVTLYTADRDGEMADVVLGHATIDKYVSGGGPRLFGAVVGRVANRIAKGQFAIGEEVFHLAKNSGEHCLHGGDKGFDRVVWDVDSVSGDAIYFSYLSVDGEEGFPGNLKVCMTYSLTSDNAFRIVYSATTDAVTPVNLSHHSFFNLKGEGCGDVCAHEIMINADYITPVDVALIPTGELMAVGETPFDFRSPALIGARVDDADEQLELGGGYDHNFVLNRTTDSGLECLVVVYEPQSGRTMEVWTTEPGVQFYSANHFGADLTGKSGKPYVRRGGFALEPQRYPDAVNQPNFPSILLYPGEVYEQVCEYRFGAR